MPITLNTVQEAIDFIEGLDGYGLVTTDNDETAAKLADCYDLVDDYSHPTEEETEER